MAIISWHLTPQFFKRVGQKVVDTYQGTVQYNDQISNRELFRTRAYRWADLFPDELIVCEKTITVIRNDPLVSATQTIPVKDVGRVVYVDKIIFATLEVLGKNTAHDLRIKGLNKRRARECKKIIEGLLLEDQAETNMSSWIEAETHRNLLINTGTEPGTPPLTTRKSKF